MCIRDRRVSDARARFDDTGHLLADGGDPWVIGAPEGAPMVLQGYGLPTVYFDAPADGETVDVADLLAANVPRPLPPSSPLVKGDRGASAYEVAVAAGFVGSEAEWLASLEGPRGDTGRGIASVTDTDGDGTATVTYDDGATQPLPLPRGPKGETGPAQSITTSTPSTGLTRITWI